MAVGGRGVSSSKRGSSVSSSVESISIGLSLTFTKVVVDQTSSSIADSLNASSNTGNTSNTDSSSSRGNSNASNTGCVSDNVGGVGNTDGGLGADLLGDVLAVLDGGGVNDGGDFVMALLLLMALWNLSALLLSNLLTMLLLDHIYNVVALGLLSRGADLLGDGPWHGMALLHRTAG